MTAFQKDNFYGYGEYIDYNVSETKSRFVARFKYKKSSKTSFINFLIKNFSVEEYFGRMDAGEAPLTILQSKGYLQPHIKKMLRDAEYPVTVAGLQALIANRIAARKG